MSSGYCPVPVTFSATSTRGTRWPSDQSVGAGGTLPARNTSAASKMASMIFTYPVQRQMLLRMA